MKLRATAKGKFTRMISNLNQAIDTGAPVTTIESRYDALKTPWKEVQEKQDEFVKLLPGIELDEEWIEKPNKTFSELKVKTDSYLEKLNEVKAQEMESKIRKETEEAEIKAPKKEGRKKKMRGLE